jgi:hypothetical protein
MLGEMKSWIGILRRKERLIEVEDVRRLFDQAQVPVCLQGTKLRRAEAKARSLRGCRPLQYLANRIVLRRWKVKVAPCIHAPSQDFI